MTRLERQSPCKINLLLNILSKRADGFHELETVMHPVPLHDIIEFTRTPDRDIVLTCSDPSLPSDKTNLAHRAATAFLEFTGIRDGLRIHLEKRVPLAAGLGGGSSNAAATLLSLNELFGYPASAKELHALAAELGSDVPFFLQSLPALATGRGEKITPLQFFPALKGLGLLLIHPGFGVSTAWAYQALAGYPEALHGRRGRAQNLIIELQKPAFTQAGKEFYNSLEAPVLHKYPVLRLYQEFLLEHGALATLMSGSGSTTFALCGSESAASGIVEVFRSQFGQNCWTAVMAL